MIKIVHWNTIAGNNLNEISTICSALCFGTGEREKTIAEIKHKQGDDIYEAYQIFWRRIWNCGIEIGTDRIARPVGWMLPVKKDRQLKFHIRCFTPKPEPIIYISEDEFAKELDLLNLEGDQFGYEKELSLKKEIKSLTRKMDGKPIYKINKNDPDFISEE